MKTRIFAFIIFSSFLLLQSCSEDEDPTPAPDKVTFMADIKPLVTASCTPCHMPGGANPNKWDDYATAKSKINLILDRVQRDPSATGFMPMGGSKLSAEKIALLKKWVSDGLLEN